MTTPTKPKLFDRLRLPANAVDVTAEATAGRVLTAVVCDGRVGLKPAPRGGVPLIPDVRKQ